MNGTTNILSIPRRPWWFWLLGLVWLAAEGILLQTVLASLAEAEPRAATVSSIVFLAMAVGGILFFSWPFKADQTKASTEKEEQADSRSSV
jgi:predicted membrane channel-forming protein YqfA (hemolysin III family)